MSDYILSMQNITKTFPGVTALDEVNMDVKEGEIHALVGENGAGKSTLIKLITGVYPPDSGTIIYQGQEMKFESPLESQQNGISVVHQELNLVECLDVAENIFLGRPIMKRRVGLPFIDWKKIYDEAAKLMERLKISVDLKTMVSDLSVAQKQIIEIAKSISYSCKLMIMDEPSATLTERELGILFDILKRLREEGVTVIYISHRLDEIFQLADTVTVLRDGKHIKTMKVADTSRPELIKHMVGRDVASDYPKEALRLGPEVLRVEGLTNERINNVSFNLHKGEILGIAGLVGAGRTELARAIFGADKLQSGEVYLNGEQVKIGSVTEAIEKRLALVPEERKVHGLVLEMSVRENITLVGIDKVIERAFIQRKKEVEACEDAIGKLRIIAGDIEREVQNLSGGNQQKVVLAKWLFADADILIFDEPTRGIDVGAKYEIYKLLTELVRQGKSVIMISSEMPELIGMCDRILVMHEGRKTGELSREEASQEKIMHLAAG